MRARCAPQFARTGASFDQIRTGTWSFTAALPVRPWDRRGRRRGRGMRSRSHDAIGERALGRGRPGPVLQRRAIRARSKSSAVPDESDRPGLAQSLLVKDVTRDARGGAVSALTTTSARAQSSSNAARSSTIESDWPSGRSPTQPKRSQAFSGSRDVAGSRASPSAASHCSAAKALKRLPTTISLPSASRTTASSPDGGYDHIVARALGCADEADQRKRDRQAPKRPGAPQNRAQHREAQERQRIGLEGPHMQRRGPAPRRCSARSRE